MVKCHENGIYITDPNQTWTATVGANLHDSKEQYSVTIDLQIDVVGETETVFRVTNLALMEPAK